MIRYTCFRCGFETMLSGEISAWVRRVCPNPSYKYPCPIMINPYNIHTTKSNQDKQLRAVTHPVQEMSDTFYPHTK